MGNSACPLGGADGVLGYDATGYFLSDYELLTAAEFRSNYWPYLFHAPIPPRLSGHVRVRQMIDRATGTYPYTVYLRNDSRAAQRMAMRGIRLQPPWLRGAPRSPSSARWVAAPSVSTSTRPCWRRSPAWQQRGQGE